MDIYKTQPHDGDIILEELRKKIALSGMGVTLNGNRLAMRLYDDKGNLVEVSCVILEVNSPELDYKDED